MRAVARESLVDRVHYYYTQCVSQLYFQVSGPLKISTVPLSSSFTAQPDNFQNIIPPEIVLRTDNLRNSGNPTSGLWK